MTVLLVEYGPSEWFFTEGLMCLDESTLLLNDDAKSNQLNSFSCLGIL